VCFILDRNDKNSILPDGAYCTSPNKKIIKISGLVCDKYPQRQSHETALSHRFFFVTSNFYKECVCANVKFSSEHYYQIYGKLTNTREIQ